MRASFIGSCVKRVYNKLSDAPRTQGGMMQFRVEMTKKEFVHIIESGRGTTHSIRFGTETDGTFKADQQATLIFAAEAGDFTKSTDGVRSLIGIVSNGTISDTMMLTLYPKYGVKGIVNMKPVKVPRSRRK